MRHCKHLAGLLEQHTNLIYMWIDSLLIKVEVTILGKLQDSCFLFDFAQTTIDGYNLCSDIMVIFDRNYGILGDTK